MVAYAQLVPHKHQRRNQCDSQEETQDLRNKRIPPAENESTAKYGRADVTCCEDCRRVTALYPCATP